MDKSLSLPDNLHVLERGWLSANQVLLWSSSELDVVDSGFCTHVEQTKALLSLHLKKNSTLLPRFLLNTHLHADHCGGNQALVDTFGFKVLVPSAEFDDVQNWNATNLGFNDLGQPCPPFQAYGIYSPGTIIQLGNLDWEIYASPGHDSYAQLLFNPDHQILISGDALWEKGFGALFPNLEHSVDIQGAKSTLNLIQEIAPKMIIPGHGSIFTNVKSALEFSMSRLAYLEQNPERNLRHVASVLLKFKLLEWQKCSKRQAVEWFISTPILKRISASLNVNLNELFDQTLQSLIKVKALTLLDDVILNS